MSKRSFVRWLYDCVKEDVTSWVQDRRENWDDEKVLLSVGIAFVGGFLGFVFGFGFGLFYGGFYWLLMLVGVVSVFQFLYFMYRQDTVNEAKRT